MLRKLAILFVLAPWVALAQQNVNFASMGTVDSGYQNVKAYESVVGTTSTIWFGAPIPSSTAPIYSAGVPTATCSSAVNLNVYGINTSTTPWSEYICSTGLSGYTWYQIGGGGGSGTITTVHNLDGTLTFTTSGTVVTGSLNLAQANTWSALQTFTAGIGVGASGTPTQFKTTFTCIQSGCSFGGVSGASTLAATTAASGFPGAGTYIWVGDGLTALDCSTGGGSVLHQCYYTGSAWTTATPATTINGQPCTMGGTCTIAPGGSAGGGLTGTYPNPTVVASALPPPATTVLSGAIAVTASNAYVICTTTCTVTPLAPAAGNQLCVWNTPGSATVITMAALGSGNYYALTSNAGYGTANHTVVSGGAVTDKFCIVGHDANHYDVVAYNGTWTD